ncbi:MAG TPA: bifunctional methylenetetrahydrofolate dehydrogenase/methenyltetrahydrofolate cyclohydrolase FolD [Sphingomonadales bacterium]|nr:bifunctional methylenetetrahydrofolate dehydrogenase/methenyltetrahydrofolate cyclohydrolase FolD [Sphingomonadales bacterium]
MSEATIIDGKAHAAKIRARVAAAAARLKQEKGIVPGLAVILIGDNPASQIYVRSKVKATVEAGLHSFEHRHPASFGEASLLALIEKLNRDPAVNGILVQLPLPKPIDSAKVLQAVSPEKDVDGFHLVNVGLLATGGAGVAPCTPWGCLLLLREHAAPLAGKKALVIGRSNIVGKPMAQLLLGENCTVTIAHSKTRDLAAECRQADIIVAAVGAANLVTGAMVKKGAVVIDVGQNVIPAPERGEGKTRLVGDVDFESVRKVAGAITPVPGGVGPMTIACLLENTLRATLRQRGLTGTDYL